MIRDKKVDEELINMGWKVLRFWDNQIRKDLNQCYKSIINKI